MVALRCVDIAGDCWHKGLEDARSSNADSPSRPAHSNLRYVAYLHASRTWSVAFDSRNACSALRSSSSDALASPPRTPKTGTLMNIGQHSILTVISKGAEGYVLEGAGARERVTLPRREAGEELEIGEHVRVFVYLDSDDEPVATTREPKARVGQCAWLRVKEVNRIGAFLEWGLPRDLFVPFAEQVGRMKEGRSYVVHLYLDNTGRIAASQKIDAFLSTEGKNFRAGDEVDLLLWERSDLGFKAVIDHTHLGMLFQRQMLGDLRPGQQMRGYILEVRPDGKINLSLQRHTPAARDALQTAILDHLKAHGGVSTLTDKSSPDAIFKAFGVSKKNFKKALGGLYREKVIVIGEGEVRLA
ncbi:GntR family transcriptional regulator [Bradymonadaceae bacterium TMQ3]|nr:GntR family transcriptional regulator [Bradymonadaceae bacterium TMQ3]TXC67675.1 GntR family transcriptional regulator [Bradymonadales bacterium TMQ1]